MLNSTAQKFNLSGNALKIFGAAFMLIDHIGVILFPRLTVLRIIGRLSFPIFSFMIAEGATHTKNKLKYFGGVFALGVICQIVLFFYDSKAKLNVLISFSIGILAVYSLELMKKIMLSDCFKPIIRLCSLLILPAAVFAIYRLNELLRIDYGFYGCLAPVGAALFKAPKNCDNKILKRLDNHFIHLLCFGVCILFMNLHYGGIQVYSIFALLPLLFYSGKRGKLNMKYFFYLFYPLHLALLEGIYMLFFK